MKITPAEGKVAIEFIDQDAGDSDAMAANVIGVGPGVKGIKVGDTVLVTESCKIYGTKIDDETSVVNSYDVIGVVEQ